MRSLFSYWHMDTLLMVFMILLCVSYFLITDFEVSRRSGYFFTGYLLIVIAVASPLQFLGENYLMSAHMASHVILLLIAAPLLVMGMPAKRSERWKKFSAFLIRFPWIPWTAGVCVMWFWHIPLIFNQLFHTPSTSRFLSVNLLQDIHVISLILAGIIFSWPVLGPLKQFRVNPLQAVLYLTAACIFCSVLGLLITFAPAGVYTHYLNASDHEGFLNIIRNQQGISAEVDRQAAGLIMWVPGCLIYLTASMVLLMKWFREKETEHVFIINEH